VFLELKRLKGGAGKNFVGGKKTGKLEEGRIIAAKDKTNLT